MSIFGRICPRCGRRVLGRMRYCGRCGCDLDGVDEVRRSDVPPRRPDLREWTEENPDPAPAASPQDGDAPTPARAGGPAPRPVQTARRPAVPVSQASAERPVPPSQGFSQAPDEPGASYEEAAEEKTPGTAERLPFGLLAAVAVFVIAAAVILIVRMNRGGGTPAQAGPAPTGSAVHVIGAGEELSPTAAPTITPLATPTPTPPPVAATTSLLPDFAVSEVTGYVYVLPPSLSVRSGPGTQYGIIATVVQGTALLRTGVLDGWTRVQIDGQEGYVPHDQVSLEEAPTPTPEPVMDFDVTDADGTVVVDSGANLRVGPDSSYDVYDYAGAGQELTRTGVLDGWTRILYDGRELYVYTELLRGGEEEEDDESWYPFEPDSEHIDFEPEEDDEPSVTESYTDSVTLRVNANVRSGPGTDYDVIGLADGGSTLDVIGISDGWYLVEFYGQTGYVLSSLTE